MKTRDEHISPSFFHKRLSLLMKDSNRGISTDKWLNIILEEKKMSAASRARTRVNSIVQGSQPHTQATVQGSQPDTQAIVPGHSPPSLVPRPQSKVTPRPASYRGHNPRPLPSQPRTQATKRGKRARLVSPQHVSQKNNEKPGNKAKSVGPS